MNKQTGRALLACILVALSAGASANTIDFQTFVTSSDLSATLSNTSTIAFQYAGDKFVGSVYYGPNNNQLYSTNLGGTGVAIYGQPIPNASGEVVVGASLGAGGFGAGNIYAGSEANGQIYMVPPSGAPIPFASVVGGVRQIFFDPGSSFGGNMIVTTNAGNIYSINGAGTASLLANVGQDAEGIDIATSAWGKYAGDLLVASEAGALRLISPSGMIDKVFTGIPTPETVSFVPTTLDAADPLQGFYVANYAQNVQFSAASNFAGMAGDAIITCEAGCYGGQLWDLHYDALTDSFITSALTMSGNAISQFEDGIFVTAARINEANGGGDTSVPEPGTLALLVLGLAAVGLSRRKHLMT